MAQPADAAYDCAIRHTQKGFADARCVSASPGGDLYRIRWGCFNYLNGSFRQQVGNVASVNAGTSSSIPNCHWYENAHGSRYVETIFS